MAIALRLILILVFLMSIVLQMVMRGIPVKELRRRARTQKDKKAAALYKLAIFGPSSELFLYLVAALSVSPLVVTAARSAWWLGLVTVLAIIWLTWMAKPIKSADGLLFSFAARLAPLVSIVVSWLQPVLKRPAHWFLSQSRGPTELYEKEDLLDFIKIQRRRKDNRISDSDLKLAISAVAFNDKKVGNVMTPRRGIKWVVEGDSIGPMIMDELHKTGQTRFPVVKEITKAAKPEAIGVLYLKDLLDNLDAKGRIGDITHEGISYINESQSLREAIDGFLQSGQLLLLVVNNFEEVSGAISLEAVLEQVFGEKISEDIDNYHDVRSVAGRQTDGQESIAKVE